MLKFSRSGAHLFARDKGGNAAFLFALAIIPIALIVGFAVDYGRAITVRGTLSDAADSAALAIGSWVGLTETELKEKAQQFFDANYASSLSSDIKSEFKVSFVGDEIVVNASASVPTTFLRLANHKHLDVSISNAITKRQRNVELALVLDTTGSMRWSGKMDALKQAANAMVDDLFGKETTSDTLDVAVVPFAAAVNVGTDKRDELWLDVDAQSQVAQEDFGAGKQFNFFNKLKSVKSSWDWQGCVRERSGSAYELSDATPSAAQPDSLFVPYFAPDEPDRDADYGSTQYGNDYIYDGLDGNECGVDDSMSWKRTAERCQKYRGKHNDARRTDVGSGPNQHCPPRAITALSNVKGTVTSAINGLEPNGYTVIPAGLLWGWRVLTPSAPFTEGKVYNDKKRVKAIVLLTDGSNDVGAMSNGHNGSDYNAFGFAAKGHLGSTSGSDAVSTLDAKAQTVCNNIKATGILIYTIGFRVDSASTLNLLKNCATKTDMYYNSPSNAQLAEIFSDIAQGLTELRVSR